MWSEGIVGVGDVAVYYAVKHYDRPSEYGIGGGRISKLSLEIGGRTVAHYDRGWDVKPTDAEAGQALKQLLERYN